ncbi:hypothetical protein [Komagataeibacter medellinensis]|uniref:hypothetical protein n=1 Tax=Komagataeibacter medellinensis TaxID=1177712 RepID=UPI0011D19B23|nr:hypothetical protein [Komagataeibacter medellinensis]
MGRKRNAANLAQQRFRGSQQARGTGHFCCANAHCGQTFGPADTFMAGQVSPDNTDELMFAHDKCQGGMLVGIWHDMSCSADTKKPAGEGGPCVRIDNPCGGGYRSRFSGS